METLLTDRAKIDFEIFLIEEGYKESPMGVLNFWHERMVIQHAIIIEWLDKVQLHINTFYASGSYSYTTSWYVARWFKAGVFDSRHEATKAAIERANEMYNAKFT